MRFWRQPLERDGDALQQRLKGFGIGHTRGINPLACVEKSARP
jgi:hypothetical protein